MREKKIILARAQFRPGLSSFPLDARALRLPSFPATGAGALSPEVRGAAEPRRAAEPSSEPPAVLFDHLIGESKKRKRNGQTQRLRGHEIDDQLEFYRRLYWQIGGLLPAQDAVDVASCASIQVANVRPIRHKTAGFRKVVIWID